MALGAVIILYLFTRLINLDLLPIFNDEANYIFWAKNIAETGQGWFISLTAGKPPLLIWIMAFLLKILPSGWHLIAGRLPSILFGLLGLIGIYKLGGKYSVILYIFSPFILFYDRIGLYDSMLSAMLVWATYFMLKNRPVLWGAFMGLAFLSKPTAIMYAAILPVIYFWKFKKIKPIIISFLISQLIANILIASRGYWNYLSRSLDYHPGANINLLTTFWNNFPYTVTWLWQWLTPPVFVFGLVAILKNKYYATLFLVPIIAFTVLGRVYFPRYFLFAIPFLYLAIGDFIKNLKYKFLLLLILIAPCLYFDYLLITNPSAAPLPEIEAWQYVAGLPSSSGFEPIYKYLENRQDQITLFVQGSMSHYPNAFRLHFWDKKNIKIIERWPLVKIDEEILEATKSGQVYLVVRHSEKNNEPDILKQLPLKIIVEGKKPGGKDTVYLTEISWTKN